MKRPKWLPRFLYFDKPPQEPEPIPMLRVVTIQKGDTILLTFPNGRRVGRDQARVIADEVHRKFGGDCEVLVLDGGIEVGIIRRGVE